MVSADSGSRVKVSGNSSATAIAEPSPGNTPIGGAEEGADRDPEQAFCGVEGPARSR